MSKGNKRIASVMDDCLGKVQLRAAAIFMILAQIAFIIIAATLARYGNSPTAGTTPPGRRHYHSLEYQKLPNLSVMTFIGLGFLMTFLKRYGLSSFGFNLLLASFAVQWATILHGIGDAMVGRGHFCFTTEGMLSAEYAAFSLLISFGVIVGKTNLLQLVIMTVLGIVGQHINERIVFDHLKVSDVGRSMVVHVFGAYYGLTISRILYNEHSTLSSKQKPYYNSDLFAFIGTTFLWVYWPTFNSAFAEGDPEQRAIINTFYALSACTVTTFLLSILLNGHAKLETAHIQNATLAGGVAVGTAANMMIEPFAAILIGCAAAVVSTVGFKYISPFLNVELDIHDTRGVHNLHGMPGILAGIAGSIASAVATEHDYGQRDLYQIFEARAPLNYTVHSGLGRSASEQAGYQFLGVVCSVGIAIVSGILTGFIMKSVTCCRGLNVEELFDDDQHWELHHSSYCCAPEKPIQETLLEEQARL